MNKKPSQSIALLRTLSALALAVAAIPTLSAVTRAETIEAFTEPYQRIAVPATEIGMIESLTVEEETSLPQSRCLASWTMRCCDPPCELRRQP
ncbi:MAG: hypothetical protein R3C56_23325 [Pirellulaceae bacterium]